MPARHDFSANRIRGQLLAALNVGTLEVMIQTQTELQKMVSMPGKGRLYAKTAKGVENIGRVAGSSPMVAMRRGIAATNANINALLAKPKGGRYRHLGDAGVHRASAPGDPPTVRSGTLRRSIQIARPKPRRQATTLGWQIGINVKYAPWLEFGTKRMRPRPYVRPVMHKMKALGLKMLRNRLRLAGLKIT